MDAVLVERIIAVILGAVVLVVAAVALKNDWKTPGLENHVFKLMLGLLALGGLLGFLAGLGIVGKA